MNEEQKRRTWRGRGRSGFRGCGGGCASAIVVLTVGLLLSIFSTAIGIGLSVRIPLTDSNITLAGSVGEKEKVGGVLPPYVRERMAGNQDFIDYTSTLTIWVAEGAALVVVGHQEGAPVVDLHLQAH